jgi:peptidoglycan hydrolase-like protein with peptidoglycan-binding domain
LREATYQTARGVRAFLRGETERKPAPLAGYPPSRAFPHDLAPGSRDAGAVFTLQLALAERGFYPPQETSLQSCPISGFYGSCTETAVKTFQKGHGLTQTGAVGQKTREMLKE